MKEHIDTDPILEAPLLASIRRTDPFVAPEGFFERFPMQVQERIAQRRARWSLSESLGIAPGALRLGFAAGTAAVLLAGAAWWLWPAAQVAQPLAVSQERPMPAVDELNWSDDELFALLVEEPAASPAAGHGFTTEELEGYLLSTEPSIDLLTEEL